MGNKSIKVWARKAYTKFITVAAGKKEKEKEKECH